jgi:HEAT repeat protein
MATAEDLIARLSPRSTLESEQALAQLIEMGGQAIPALLAQIDDLHSNIRPLAMQALAEIADASCADRFYQAVHDKDEAVRAWAANALVRLRDPRRVEALLDTFNDQTIDLPGPHTFSSAALVEEGPSVLPHIAPLLANANLFTRERAFWVIAGIVAKMPAYQNQWEVLCKKLGDYDPNQPPKTQQITLQNWIRWCEQNSGQ